MPDVTSGGVALTVKPSPAVTNFGVRPLVPPRRFPNRHKINKIKSKKYRKIRKRKADRLKGAELDAQTEEEVRARDEEEERERVRERMSLNHRNTSKWARRQLRRGNLDVNTRKALQEQVREGERLSKKREGESDGDSDGSDSDSAEAAKRQARKIIDDDARPEDGAKGDLFKLEFMRKGMERNL